MRPVRALRTRGVLVLAAWLSMMQVASAENAARAAPGDADAEAVARQHFQLGELHYGASEFVAALAEYQAGYDAVPLPGFLVNIAQCERRMGDLRRARIAYEKFVLVAPDSPLVPEVRGLIRELDKQLGGSAALAPPALHAERAGPAGAGQPPALRAAPGHAPTGAAAPGLQLTAPASTAAPTAKASLVGLDAAPAPAGADGAASSFSRWWFWGTLAVVTLAGAGTILALSPGGATTIHDGSLGTLRR